MRLGEVSVYLQRIRELDRCFLVLGLRSVPLAALEILLFLNVRVMMAAGKTDEQDTGERCGSSMVWWRQ